MIVLLTLREENSDFKLFFIKYIRKEQNNNNDAKM